MAKQATQAVESTAVTNTKKLHPITEEIMSAGKVVRVEPSPFKEIPMKLVQKQAKVNSAGYAIKDLDGNLVTSDSPVNNAVRVPGTSMTVRCPLTPSGLKTGLDMWIDNPYNDEPVYYPAWGEKILKGNAKVMLQHVLEYKHKKDYDYYTGKLFDQISPSDKVSELPFFLTPQSAITLHGNVNFFDLSNPIDEVKYYSLRVRGIVAKSYAELQDGKNPIAVFYIVDQDEVQDAKVKELRKDTRAATILEELLGKGEIIIKFARCLENDDKSLNPDKAFKWLHDYYKKSEESYSTFMKYYELFNDAGRRDQFMAAAILQDLIIYGVIRKREGKYYWVKPETDDNPMQHFEWASKEKVIKDFILAPEYAEEVSLAMSIYESRK